MTNVAVDERAIENMIDTLRELQRLISKQEPLPIGEVTGRAKWIQIGDLLLELHADAIDQYDRFMKKWNRAPWTAKWSSASIEKIVHNAMGEAWEHLETSGEIFAEAAKELDKEPPMFTVTMPLIGVDLQMLELLVGRVRIVRFTDTIRDKLFSAVSDITKTTLNPEEEKQRYLLDTKSVLDGLVGTVCAQVDVPGDSERAVELAENECQPVIDVLQLFASIFEHRKKQIQIDFRSYEASGFRPVLLLSSDMSHFNRSHSRFGAAGAFVLNEQRLARIQELGLKPLFDLTAKPDSERSDVERLILRAVHWFSNGELQRNDENKIQSYVTCLDMFFSSRDGEVTAAVQDGVAYMLGHERAERLYLASFVGDVYNYRSRASHEGEEFDVPTKIDELRNLTLSFLAEMLAKREIFQTKKQIRDWVYAERFS
jgi:hypothetical protein